MRKQFGKEFKTKVAIAAIKGEMTIAEISSKFGVHSTQINKWKKQALAGFPGLFVKRESSEKKQLKEENDELYKRVGQLNMENEWLKKKLLS